MPVRSGIEQAVAPGFEERGYFQFGGAVVLHRVFVFSFSWLRGSPPRGIFKSASCNKQPPLWIMNICGNTNSVGWAGYRRVVGETVILGPGAMSMSTSRSKSIS